MSKRKNSSSGREQFLKHIVEVQSLPLNFMLEQVAAIIAVLLIIPGWAIALIAISAYLWKILSGTQK